MTEYKAGEAPKVTLEDIEANIVAEHYFSGIDGVNGAIAAETYVARYRPEAEKADLIPLGMITFCVLITKNKYTVWGVSKPVSVENFDPALGMKYARANAIKELWAPMAYLLAEKRANEG